MIAPGMSSRAKQVVAAIAVLLALLLPKRVPCGYPGGECTRAAKRRQLCQVYEVEPIGFYLVERVLGRDVGFAYSTGETCHGPG
jgi:hypothetical protein